MLLFGEITSEYAAEFCTFIPLQLYIPTVPYNYTKWKGRKNKRTTELTHKAETTKFKG